MTGSIPLLASFLQPSIAPHWIWDPRHYSIQYHAVAWRNTTLYPSGGAFTGLAGRFVDKAFGVAVGWNYFIIWAAVLANEYNTISAIFLFWSDKVPLWGYFLIFWFAFLAF